MQISTPTTTFMMNFSHGGHCRHLGRRRARPRRDSRPRGLVVQAQVGGQRGGGDGGGRRQRPPRQRPLQDTGNI